MIPIEIKPYCNKCNQCKPSNEFNKTSNGTYRYTCKVCEIDSERNERKQLYEETKQRLEEQEEIIKQLSQDKDIDYIIYHCPYSDCGLMCIVYKADLNCRVFRCGYNKSTNQQIGQHLPKVECDKLRNDPNIIGCARPYRFEINSITPIICDYI